MWVKYYAHYSYCNFCTEIDLRNDDWIVYKYSLHYIIIFIAFCSMYVAKLFNQTLIIIVIITKYELTITALIHSL